LIALPVRLALTARRVYAACGRARRPRAHRPAKLATLRYARVAKCALVSRAAANKMRVARVRPQRSWTDVRDVTDDRGRQEDLARSGRRRTRGLGGWCSRRRSPLRLGAGA